MTLRLVGKDPPKRQKGGPRHETVVLSPDEQRKARQALRNLKDHFGTWACLADAMGMRTKSLINAVSGRCGLSPAVLLRAMRASGLTLDDMLGAPATAGRCRACGKIKRVA
ncbi:MAG TPA: transcriptional regulator [Polyangiaceae bacterium]|nr:transcriptional regulator [Polyangiaceae bacterium]